MSFTALNCPQCGAPLPRVALWRSVQCPACGSLLAKTESVVARDSFRQALNRALENASRVDAIVCGNARYQLLQTLGVGEISQVYLGLRLGSTPLLATIKLSTSSSAPSVYSREAQVSDELQRLNCDAAGPYFSRLLPEVIAHGTLEEDPKKCALILRHPSGFSRSLSDLNAHFSAGLDPRHAVWIWRRMLETLQFIHKHGWAHGDVRPEHSLVHAENHSVRLIGWSAAKNGGGEHAKVMDLSRSARVIQVLLCGAGGPEIPRADSSGYATIPVPKKLLEND